jgi:tetratricopeptide (TPR) repeat protein
MHEASKARTVVMISSTTLDLPAHRKEVLDACLQQDMFPMMMEHLPASEAEAVAASVELVDKADIYIGVFAHRYGHVPKKDNPRQVSITEIEYARAVEREIPRLIFIIDKNHPLADFTINDIDTGKNATKLARFKRRVEAENTVNSFTTPADLRARVINSLSQHRRPAPAIFPMDEFWENLRARLEQLASLNNPTPRIDEGLMFNMLALRYKLGGQPGRAVVLQRLANTMASDAKRADNLASGLCELSDALRLTGTLRMSESDARGALAVSRELKDRAIEAFSLDWFGLTLAARGVADESESALRRALRMHTALYESEGESSRQSFLAKSISSCSFLAQRMLWLGEFKAALSLANSARKLADEQNFKRHVARTTLREGQAALGLNDLATAGERLRHALASARAVSLIEEELFALVALAELRRRQGDLKAARALLDDIWDTAERGPYPLFHADACCVSAEIERDEGNREKAVEAATKAYELAWCDGPPFAYHWGLEKARALLRELGAGEPELPAFDESKFEPMPEVEIDPADEFGAGGKEGTND